jgi:tRNA/rRNA methyltransferase
LLTPAQCDRLEVVLVSPRNPLNIGAVARAMANFGLCRLRVVAPYAPPWRSARSAVGAPQLLEKALETSNLGEAVAACTLVVGTGDLTYRKPEQAIVPLPELAALVGRELERGGRIALVFGSEKHGLTRDDLSHCHCLAVIPTSPDQPSMNLGQAAAVCLYELAARANSQDSPLPGGKPLRRQPAADGPPCDSGHLDILAGLIEETMLGAGYSPRGMQPANRYDLRLFLRRMAPNAEDTRRMLGLFRRVLWRLQHPQAPRR